VWFKSHRPLKPSLLVPAAHQAKPLFIGLPETPFMSSDGVLSFLPHDRPVETHFMCSSLLNDCPSVSLIPHTGF
jgi:hypothetical protein